MFLEIERLVNGGPADATEIKDIEFWITTETAPSGESWGGSYDDNHAGPYTITNFPTAGFSRRITTSNNPDNGVGVSQMSIRLYGKTTYQYQIKVSYLNTSGTYTSAGLMSMTPSHSQFNFTVPKSSLGTKSITVNGVVANKAVGFKLTYGVTL
jgi:hypothetical protein